MEKLTAAPTRPLAALAAVLATAALLALPASALADPDDAPAYEQRRAAVAMANDGRMTEAADYLVLTAAELAADDTEKDDNLRLAARLYHHAGQLEDSWRTMVNAGVAAYRTGDALRASHDLVDATVVAMQAGNSMRAWDTAEKVGFVLRTADLQPEERLAILERITIQAREVRAG